MAADRILKNIFSNWANLVISLVLAFFVSPLIVQGLGKDGYGLWVIIVSITGYFTVIDLGVNTAIIKFISEFHSQNKYKEIIKVYSNSIVIFSLVSIFIVFMGAMIGFNFNHFFQTPSFTQKIVLATFGIVVGEIAIGMFFSIYSSTLSALQHFVYINAVSITTSLIRNALIVFLLLNGHGILTLAIIHLSTSILRYGAQYKFFKMRYPLIEFDKRVIQKDSFKLLLSYSFYSFIISISLKVLFYTDSLVIGKLISFEQVTYYAIPSSLLDYVEKIIWAMIAVLVPIISINDAAGHNSDNQLLYLHGTRYSLLISGPIVISLFLVGPDFITLWMGQDIGSHSAMVLKILTVGYAIAISQLIAHGILKGIARHRMLALILLLEAIGNLFLSIELAPIYGIEGVAFATALPLGLATIALVIYTCRRLKISVLKYFCKGYLKPIICILIIGTIFHFNLRSSSSYSIIFGKCFLISLSFLVLAIPVCVDRNHLTIIYNKILLYFKGREQS